ncbi:MAG: PKD domain-containing protein [Thermoplasmata archaeon]|nr:MAG: PKD domain-containing protein [Thermoplasmata archaeon]
MGRNIRVKNLFALILVFLLFLQLTVFIDKPKGIVSAEPNLEDNLDYTVTATWDFNDPSDYLLNNTSMRNGEVELTLGKYWWNQTDEMDFTTGNFINTTTTPQGEVTLISQMNATNFVKTGDFSSSQNWTFTPSANISSSYNGAGENAELSYSYFVSELAYLKPANADDGTVTYVPPSSYSMNDTGQYTEVGYSFEGGFPNYKRSFFYFDLSTIPLSAIITNVTFYAKIENASPSSNHLIDIHVLEVSKADSDATELYTDCGNGTLYIYDDNSLSSGADLVYHEWNLGAQAISDVQNYLDDGWFGIGIHEEADDGLIATISASESGNSPQLNVSYLTSPPATFDETAYVNQTLSKPKVTPNFPQAVNLSFNFSVEKYLSALGELMVQIDNATVWSQPIALNPIWTPVYVDGGIYMNESRDYKISLQLNLIVNSGTVVDCLVKFDDVRITAVDFFPKGNYTSMEYDVGSLVIWDEMSWNFEAPPESVFTIRTRTSNGTFWGDWSSEYTNNLGEQIIPQIDQKIQYTVNLSTVNFTRIPVLYDVNISYEKYFNNGTIEMKEDFKPDKIRDWGTFKWEEQTNGQNITYLYSIDSGANWSLVPLDGNLSDISTTQGKIRFKANFTTYNTTKTPTLLKWNLTYEISELPTLYGRVDPGFGYITTWFNFTVRYSDPENEAPLNITLNITQGTSHIGNWQMYPVNNTDLNYTDGKWYFFNETNFTRGTNYSFHFAAQDPNFVWSLGQIRDGPYVLNSPPRITTSDVQGAEGGKLYYVDYEAEDLEDEGNLSWYLETDATWLAINGTTGNLSGTPPSGDKGTYWVNVTVRDSHGGLDKTSFNLLVGDTIPPIADAGDDGEVYEDVPYQFDGSNSTDNIGIENFTWYFGDGSVAYGENASHMYTKSGHYIVVLIVKDPLNNEDMDIINITVINNPPIADAGPDRNVEEGETVFLDGSNSYDTPSDNDSLIFLWDFDGDGEFDDGVGPLANYTWHDQTAIKVRLKVMDNDGDYNIDEVNVTVRNVDPVVDIEDFYAGEKGSEIIIIASFYDPGNDKLEFRWDWENDGVWDTGRTTDFIVNHTWGHEGVYTILVEVWDGVSNGTDTATVEITKRNSPPEISDIGSRQLRFNSSYTIDLAQFIHDEDTPLSSIIVTTSDPEYITIDGLNITLRYPEEMIGESVDVTVTVSDGILFDSEIFTVVITQNYPPTMKEPFPNVEFEEDGESLDAFNLNDHFEDNDGDPLEFDFVVSNPNLIVILDDDGTVTFKASPNWAGSANVRFLAEDPRGAFADGSLLVTVTHVNDPPIILGQIKFTKIPENENWSIDLDDHFLDLDNFNLTFTCNYEEIKIDPITHEAVWVPGGKKELKGVKFTASDGEHSVSLDPIDLGVIEPEPFNWLYIVLALIVGAFIFGAYREIRYRYTIEEVFLVDNAGVLLVHISRGESKAIDAKLVSGMLTAVQEFVKDSFMGNNEQGDMKIDEGALGKLEYGDFQIVIERGSYAFLSAVISGYDNKRLRKRMRDVVEEFESKYSSVLADWDGDMDKFAGTEKIVGRLIKGSSMIKEISDDAECGIEESNIEGYTEPPAEELPQGDFGDVPMENDEIR